MRIFPMPINYRVLNLFSMPIGIFTCQKGKMCNNSLTGKTHRILPMLQIYCIFLHNLVLTRCATLLLNCKFPSTVCYAVTWPCKFFTRVFLSTVICLIDLYYMADIHRSLQVDSSLSKRIFSLRRCMLRIGL